MARKVSRFYVDAWSCRQMVDGYRARPAAASNYVSKMRITMTNEIARTKATTAANCRCCPPLSRRQIFAGAAAIAAANVLPATVARGQDAKSKVIDTHYHFYPP